MCDAVLGADSPPVTPLEGGSKGANLHRLTRAGFAVPRWTILGVRVFTSFAARSGIDTRIASLLQDLSTETSQRISAAIEREICGAPLDAETRGAVEAAHAALAREFVAVRSSAVDEDGDTHSFAGQLSSELNVRGIEDVCASVQRCWASAYSARSLRYRLQHGLPRPSGVAVVLQEMVRAEKSGVVFTANAADGNRDQMIISAVYGLGEALVSGEVDADTIVLDRRTGTVEQCVPGGKERCLQPRTDHTGCEYQAAPDDAGAQLALSPGEIETLATTASRIEQVYGRTLDIEWAFAHGELYILQARPLTATGQEPSPRPSTPAAGARQDSLRIWDNSNIIESFGGSTSMLTFTVGQYVYRCVFYEYYKFCGVPQRELERAEGWLRNLIAYFDGHVYYNLLNWYQMLRPLPFYRSLQVRMFERSIGVSEPTAPELIDSIAPFIGDSPSSARSKAICARVAWRSAWLWITMPSAVRAFLARYEATYREFDGIDYEHLDGAGTYMTFQRFERELLPRFGQMIAIDNTVGTSVGVLFALTGAWLPNAPDWFFWEMVKPAGNVSSAEPATELERLARWVARDEVLANLVEATPPEEMHIALVSHGYEELRDAAAAYIERFGYRSLNELKLEAPTMREDPGIFYTLLRSAARAARVPLVEGASAGAEEGERFLRAHLRGWRLAVYRTTRARARDALRARESVRFCRTRSFGIVKRMFRSMGRALQHAGALNDATDVFHLRLEELRGGFEGTLGSGDLRALVELRREQQERHRDVTPPARFETGALPYWHGQMERAGWYAAGVASSAVAGSLLHGIPCGRGVAEGAVSVVTEPTDVRGGIIVAYRTDPGWVAILPSATGLLIERGSPLTHLAIVARELGVPTIVQIPQLTQRLRSGTRVRMDGATGEIVVLS